MRGIVVDQVRGILRLALTNAARVRATRVAAILLLLSARRGLRTPARVGSEYRVLVLSKAGHVEDMEAALHGTKGLQLFLLDRGAVKAMARAFLPASVADNNYCCEDPEISQRKSDYRDFVRETWQTVQAIRRFDAVTSGNFGYWAEREFGAALHETGTPFVVLHKECLKAAGWREYFRILYRQRRGRFNGTKMLVYNEVEREDQTGSGVAPVEQIVVTGMPRLDRLHRWRIQESRGTAARPHAPQVLFFAFPRNVGLPSRINLHGIALESEVSFSEPPSDWGEFHSDVHRAIVDLAYENSDVRVVVKIKGGAGAKASCEEAMGIKNRRPRNLIVVYGGDPMLLICQSDVVAGFGSTALLEAIASGRPVVIPRFLEAASPRMQPYIIDLGDSVDYADSAASFKYRLVCLARERRDIERELRQNQKEVLTKWVGNSDGAAGVRVRQAILAEIDRSADVRTDSVA
ncbi:MAG: hypothetical protein WD005_00915 [Haliea sp.]